MNGLTDTLQMYRQRFNERLERMENERIAFEKQGWTEIFPYVMVDPEHQDYVIFITGDDDGVENS